MCLRNHPSALVEKHNKPEVEMNDLIKKNKLKNSINHRSSKQSPLVLVPIQLVRSEHEYCLIEPSINSVRVSFVFKKMEQIDKLVCAKISSFFARRADSLYIMRKTPIAGYDISFLVTNFHLEKFEKDRIIDWLLDFIESMDKEINDIKLNINTQTRIAASWMVSSFVAKNKQGQ